MKTLDDAVIELNGVYPEFTGDSYEESSLYVCGRLRLYESAGRGYGGRFICEKEQFQQRAKELGFINGYRYGVEYKTDGKRPDLPGDVAVVVTDERGYPEEPVVILRWSRIKSFKITDPRYKPADTSYLEKAEVATVTTERDAALSAVSEFRKLPKRLQELLKEPFEKALSQFESEAKAKSERDRIISAAEIVMLTSRISNTQRKTIARLYEKGFLKLPE